MSIVIAGGGLVGASCALALDRAGFEVTVLEPRPPTDPAADPRTVALSPGSLAFLERLGVSLRTAAGTCPYQAMEVWDGDGTGRVRFEASEHGVPELGVIVPNGIALAALWARLRGERIRVVEQAVTQQQRDGDRTRVALSDGQTLSARLLVAADGANSPLRGLADIDVDRRPTGQRAVATSVVVERAHEDTAWQRFLDTGPLAFLPLPDDEAGQHRVSVVWSLDDAEAARVEALDDEAFRAALTRAFEARLGEVLAVGRRGAFPLVQVQARRYVTDGVVLVGDAAHVLHPLAGQGVNLGLQDVAALADELADIARGPAADRIGDPALLARYERRRRPDAALALGAMDGLKRLFGAGDPGVRLLRNLGMGWVDAAAPVKRAFAEHALGLGAR